MKVLYIDDDEDMGEILCMKLGQKGVSVDYVNSELQGLEKFNPDLYSAVIVDYFMPRMDGIEIIKRLQEKFGSVTAILLTGADSKEIRENVKSLGVEYIVKGFTLDYIERLHSIIMKRA